MAFTTTQLQPTRAVIDTNILFSPSVRNLLLHIASEELFQPFIPVKCLEELERVLHREKPHIQNPFEYVLTFKNHLQHHFPGALMTVTRQKAEQLVLPDSDDRYVLAAAIKANANYIVTNNLRDFPTSVLEQYGVTALSADDFVQMLIAGAAELVLQAAETHWKSLKTPAKSSEEYLNALHNAGLKNTRRWLEQQAAFPPKR